MRMACMLAILLTALLAPCARAATPPTHVTGKLLADTSAIQPGATFTLAVTLTIDPDWHIYWTNPGDSGTPTQITFDLPTGFTAAPVQFPLPIQFNQPGDIVGYGYRNAATFTARITAPECKRLLYLVNPDDTRRDRFSEREGPARPLLGLSN